MCCMISQSTGRPRLSSCPVLGTRPVRPEECMYERRSSANSKRAHSAGHRTSVCVCACARQYHIWDEREDGRLVKPSMLTTSANVVARTGLLHGSRTKPRVGDTALGRRTQTLRRPCGSKHKPFQSHGTPAHMHARMHAHPANAHTQKCTIISNCTCMYLHMHPQMPTSWLHMHARKLVAQTRVAHCQPDCVELVHTLAGNHAQAHGCNDNNLQSN